MLGPVFSDVRCRFLRFFAVCCMIVGARVGILLAFSGRFDVVS